MLNGLFFSRCHQEGIQDPQVGPRRGSFSSRNLMVDDIDTDDNPQLVSIYVKDIYKYLNELEVSNNSWIFGYIFRLLKFAAVLIFL